MSRGPRTLNLRAVLYGVLALTATFIVVSNGLLAQQTRQIQREQTLAAATGRQQVVAEQIGRLAWQLSTAPSAGDRQRARDQLRRRVAELREDHRTLVGAPEFRRAAGAAGAAPLAARMHAEVEGYLAAATRILLTPQARLTAGSADLRQLDRQAAGPLTAVLSEASALMQRSGAAHIRRVNTFAWIRLGSLLTMLVIASLLIHPLERRIRQAQAELIRERDFARQIMSTVAQGLSVTDPEGRFEYVNPAYARLLNVTPESLLGRTPFDITFEEDHAALAAAKARREVGETSTYETRLRRADGAAVPVLVTGAPRLTEGGRTGTIASITDLTERKQHEQTLRTLAVLSHSLEREQTPEGVAERALDVLSQAMDLAWLNLSRLEGDRFVPRAISGTMPPGLRDQVALGVSRGEGAIWETLGAEAVYLQESRIEAYVALGVRSVALVPLPAADGVTQVLCAYRGGEARPWSDQERVLLEAATRSMAAALERAELHHQAQEAADYAQTLLAVSALVERALEPAVMAQQALELLAPAVDIDWGSVLVVRGDMTESLTAWSRNGLEVELHGEVHRAQIQRAMTSGLPVYVDADSGTRHEAPDLPGGLKSAAWIPLTASHDAQYIYVVARLHGGESWSPRDRDLLTAAARTVRVAFERQEHLRVIEQASLTDPLTGLGNRRALDRALAALTEHGDAPFALITIDLDGLKQVNDTLGHEWGDVMLREFGRGLQASVQTDDRVYRLGGDEYVVLLQGCPPDPEVATLTLVDRAADQVRLHPELRTFQASAGLASWPDDGPSAGALLHRADERMYQQKRARQRQQAPP